jgi:Xaa-Pro aminopeptidase
MKTAVGRASTAPKIARLQAIMESKQLDAVVVCSYQNVTYFGGTYLMSMVALPDRMAFLVVPRGQEPTLVVCGIETRQVMSQTDIKDVRDYVEFADNPTEMMARVLAERGLMSGSIGVDARRLPLASGDLIREKLRGAELVPIDDEIELAQSVKDRTEIEILERGANATLAAAEETAAELLPGSTERQFATSVFLKLGQKGGSPLFLVFASGERTMQAHPESSDRALKAGELWRIDFGARFHEVINSDLGPRAKSSRLSRASSSARGCRFPCRTSATAWVSQSTSSRCCSRAAKSRSRLEWSSTSSRWSCWRIAKRRITRRTSPRSRMTDRGC